MSGVSGARRADVLVLGGGMVGLGTALALQARGCAVALVERGAPAGETSFGNAGLIQAEAVVPYAFPRDARLVASVLAGRAVAARVRWADLPWTAPWLIAYARQSRPDRVAAAAAALAPLVHAALPEHEALIAAAGAGGMIRRDGYLRLFRDARAFDAAAAEAEAVAARFDVPFALVEGEELRRMEPHLGAAFTRAIHQPSPARAEDPGDLGTAYAGLLADRGGLILRGDANTLRRAGGGWQVDTADGAVAAEQAVVALGPWSGDLLRRFGLRIALGVKRGYHRHYRLRGNATLRHLLVDEGNGFVLTPNRRGLRLTSGAEFARRDSRPDATQIDRAERLAGDLFPLGDRLDAAPWMGSRPCLPDLLPAIGPLPGVPGLWANFAHQHLGFTLGPATGRLLAEAMTGAVPFTDPAPYAPARWIPG